VVPKSRVPDASLSRKFLDASGLDPAGHQAEFEKTVHNYNVQGLDGGKGAAKDTGAMSTSINEEIHNANANGAEKKEDDVYRLLRILEQIEWLNERIVNLQKEIEKLQQRISTRSSFIQAIEEGRALTEAEKTIGKQYQNPDGTYNLQSAKEDNEEDVTNRQKNIQDLADSYAEKEELENIINEREKGNKINNESHLSNDFKDHLLKTSIKAENVKSEFNTVALGQQTQQPLKLEEEQSFKTTFDEPLFG
ncbi:MAG: hypothetical protein KAJ86_07800, partial [Alphaproteobacteria bacterium]|nr:hypothetical protein [Alphaproteobacteria bacterium]